MTFRFPFYRCQQCAVVTKFAKIAINAKVGLTSLVSIASKTDKDLPLRNLVVESF